MCIFLFNRGKSAFTLLALFSVFVICSCKKESIVAIPKTVQFETYLSAYNLYEENMSELKPAANVHLLELSAVLYSNEAMKQRLIKVPTGTSVTRIGNGIPMFPNGTILVKTFYYYHNETDTSEGIQVIETRLLIKESDEWNVAAYEWNEAQTDAVLKKEGVNTQVSWINMQGVDQNIDYRIPSQAECVKCHQNNEELVPLGPSLRNLNRGVVRDGLTVNQLDHLQSEGVLNVFDVNDVTQIPDYKDMSISLEERARAYLDMNCASCHNPDGLSEAEKKGYDFRYETSLSDTRIEQKKSKIINVMETGRMPDVGVTLVDEEGIEMIREYLNSL